jgi:hypothetical protein
MMNASSKQPNAAPPNRLSRQGSGEAEEAGYFVAYLSSNAVNFIAGQTLNLHLCQ